MYFDFVLHSTLLHEGVHKMSYLFWSIVSFFTMFAIGTGCIVLAPDAYTSSLINAFCVETATFRLNLHMIFRYYAFSRQDDIFKRAVNNIFKNQ